MRKSFKNILKIIILSSLVLLYPLRTEVKAETDPDMPPQTPSIEIGERAVKHLQIDGINTYIFKDPVPIKIFWQGEEELSGDFQIIRRVDGENCETIIDRNHMSDSGGRLFYTCRLNEKYAGKAFNLKVRAVSKYGLVGPWASLDGEFVLDLEKPSVSLSGEKKSDTSYELEFLIKDENLDRDKLDLLVSARDGQGRKLSVQYDKNFSQIDKNIYKLKLNFREAASYTVKVRAYDLTGKESNVFKKEFILGMLEPSWEKLEEESSEERLENPNDRGQKNVGRELESRISKAQQTSSEGSEKIEISQEKKEIKPIYIDSLRINLSGSFKKLMAEGKMSFRTIDEDFIVKAYSKDPVNKEGFKFVSFRDGIPLKLNTDFSYKEEESGYMYEFRAKKEDFARPGFYDLAFCYDEGNREKDSATGHENQDEGLIKFTFKVKSERRGNHLFTVFVLFAIILVLSYEKIKNFILF